MSRKKLFLYALGGWGINLLNLIVGSYLCSALLIEGFSEAALPFHTYAQKDLVIISIWGFVILASKIIDGIIDIPIGLFLDWYKNKFNNIKVILGVCSLSTVLIFAALLIIPSNLLGLNTLYYGIVLSMFYICYTATMECYYSTFNEVASTNQDLQFLSNCKSVFDICYFIVGYVLIAYTLTILNIRVVALISLFGAVSMMLPILLLKTSKQQKITGDSIRVSIIESLRVVSRDYLFTYWLIAFGLMTFGLQLFLGGINEYFSFTGLNMIITMASVFVPIPITFYLTNKYTQQNGIISTVRLSLLFAVVGFLVLFYASTVTQHQIIYSIVAGLLMSCGVGTIFSIGYSIPARLSARQNKLRNKSFTASYFALQGLISAIATGLGSGVILVHLKQYSLVSIIPLITSLAMLVAFGLLFSKRARIINYIGEHDD